MTRLYTDISIRYPHTFRDILMRSEDLHQERKGRDSGDTQESKYQQNMTDMGR